MNRVNLDRVDQARYSVVFSQHPVLKNIRGGNFARKKASLQELDIAVATLRDEVREEVLKGEFGQKIEPDFALRFTMEEILAQKRAEVLSTLWGSRSPEEAEELVDNNYKSRLKFEATLQDRYASYADVRDGLSPTDSLEPGSMIESRKGVGNLRIQSRISTPEGEFVATKTVKKGSEEGEVYGGVLIAKYKKLQASEYFVREEQIHLPDFEAKQQPSRVLNLIRTEGVQNGKVDVDRLRDIGAAEEVDGIKYKRIYSTGEGHEGKVYYICKTPDPEGLIKLISIPKLGSLFEPKENVSPSSSVPTYGRASDLKEGLNPTITIPKDEKDLSKFLSMIVGQETRSTAELRDAQAQRRIQRTFGMLEMAIAGARHDDE